jgi:hypothetical protein
MAVSDREIYVSTDIEADGPIPGPNSMVSIGSAAFTADGTLLATFAANLEPLPGAAGNPVTMEWWAQHPDAWAAVGSDRELPEVVMPRYERWLRELPGRPVFVGYPAGYDFMFVHWYLVRYTGASPFGLRALDVRTYAMAVLGRPYLACGREQIAPLLVPDRVHTHVAVEDAIEQGEIFCALLQKRSSEEPPPHDRSPEGGEG